MVGERRGESLVRDRRTKLLARANRTRLLRTRQVSAARRQRDATEPLFSSFNSPTNHLGSSVPPRTTCRLRDPTEGGPQASNRALLPFDPPVSIPFSDFRLPATKYDRPAFRTRGSSSSRAHEQRDPRNEQADTRDRANPSQDHYFLSRTDPQQRRRPGWNIWTLAYTKTNVDHNGILVVFLPSSR